jgi:hypothetical protein
MSPKRTAVHRVRWSEGVTHVISIIILVLLVIGIVMIIQSRIWEDMQPKSVFIAGENGVVSIPPDILYFIPKQGEPFHLVDQPGNVGGSPVMMKLFAPDGRVIIPDTSTIQGSLYGKFLYIYPNPNHYSTQCDYIVSDVMPSMDLPKMIIGKWTIQLIDTYANILVDSYEAEIKDGTTSNPKVGGSPGRSFFENCTEMINIGPSGQKPTGPFSTGPPMNMTYYTFDGNDYLEFANDPHVTFNGDLSISLWMKPTDISATDTDSAHWQTVIGKGKVFGVNNEDDNYQLVIIGNELYFEWTDKNSPNNHYHIQTNSNPLQEDAWTYVTMVVAGGVPKLYKDGQPLSFGMYNGNVPNQGTSASVPINLKDTQYPLHIGRQESSNPAWHFYYRGDIGDFALYNRGLSPTEILYNNATYRA